jgi:hypothetical protein
MPQYNKYKILKKNEKISRCNDPPAKKTTNKSGCNKFKKQNLEYDKHTLNFIKT